MMVFSKPLNQINLEDIKYLINSRIGESTILEYKREICSNTKEIAKDVSAMANSEGGFIIYGLDEDDSGKAKEIMWIDNTLGNKERFDSIFATTINPCISYRIIEIINPDNEKESLYLIYIEKSKSIHMVIKGKDNRYYKRSGRTVQPFEHSEIMLKAQNQKDRTDKNIELIEKLDKDYETFSGLNLENISIISYIIIPSGLFSEYEPEEIKSIIDQMTGNKPIVGITGISYKGSVSISNFTSRDIDFWKRLVLIHNNGIIELRIHHNDFASTSESMRMAGLVHWATKLFTKLNYYGDFNLFVKVNHINKFYYHSTFGVTSGEYNLQGGNLIENLNFPSIMILDEEKIKELIIKISKKIGTYLSISGDGAYKDIISNFEQRNLDQILNYIM